MSDYSLYVSLSLSLSLPPRSLESPLTMSWGEKQSEQNAGIFYNMIAELRKQTDEVEPTKFHEWLKELDDMGKLFRVYTQ